MSHCGDWSFWVWMLIDFGLVCLGSLIGYVLFVLPRRTSGKEG